MTIDIQMLIAKASGMERAIAQMTQGERTQFADGELVSDYNNLVRLSLVHLARHADYIPPPLQTKPAPAGRALSYAFKTDIMIFAAQIKEIASAALSFLDVSR